MADGRHTSHAVSWPYLVPIALLALFTTTLSAIAVFSPSLFYAAMNMPVPDSPFMTLSWAARNTAIAIGLWSVVFWFRTPHALLVALVTHLTMDILDAVVARATATPRPAPAVLWIVLLLEAVLCIQLVRLLPPRHHDP